jgi:hypothetical protein
MSVKSGEVCMRDMLLLRDMASREKTERNEHH